MSLDSLLNPLASLAVSPRSLQLASNTLSGSSVWDVNQQYFANDAVFSSINGGLYIYTPLSDEPSCVLGGDDPSQAGAPWVSASPVGANPGSWLQPTGVPTFVPGGASAPLTVTNGTITVPPNSTWLSIFNCDVTTAAGWAAADNIQFTFTGNGTLGTAAVTRAWGSAASTTFHYSSQCTLFVGATGTTISLTAPTTGAAVTSVLNGTWLVLRLS